MQVDMIKPYKITSIREEPDGNKTVFFSISKTVNNNGLINTSTMDTAIYVLKEEDIDEVLFKDLEKGGWL